MGRMRFNSRGQIESVDLKLDGYFSGENYGKEEIHLRKSSDLEFLKEDGNGNKNESGFEPIIDNSSWSLHHEGGKLEPLKFSNNKTQEDIVNEILGAIAGGNKIIFLHGVCGNPEGEFPRS